MADDSTENKSGGGLQLNKKVAGLPTWGWLGLVVAGGVVFMVWRNSTKNAAAQTTNSTQQGTPVDYAPLSQIETLEAQIRDLQGNTSTDGSTPTGGGLPAVSNLSVTYQNSTLRATWDAVPGATWYTIFWRTPRGSTGGTKIMATTATQNGPALGVKSGDSVSVLVYPSNVLSPTDEERGPDATASVTIP